MISTTFKIAGFGIKDFLRSKWTILYSLFFLLVTEGMFRFSGQGSKVIISMMSITIFIIPLISIIFGSSYFYNSREFIQLLLTQPVKRRAVYQGLYMSVSATLSLCFSIGITVPLLWRNLDNSTQSISYFYLVLSGVCLTCIFVGLSFLYSIYNNDKSKGLGMSILTWLFLAVIYDGIILLIVFLFNDYPLEKVMIALSVMNPIDLARILLLINIDISALMGYTGAVFENFFGNSTAIIFSLSSLFLWVLLPFQIGMRKFQKMDL